MKNLQFRKYKYFAALFSFLVILLFVSAFYYKFVFTIKTNGQIFPQKQWILYKGNDGNLNSVYQNLKNGFIEEFKVIQPERGDAARFKLNKKIKKSGNITQNDTVGVFQSYVLNSKLASLNTDLVEAEKMQIIYATGEKTSVIELAQKELKASEEMFFKTQKMLARNKELYEQELVSEQELEILQSEYEIQKLQAEAKNKEIEILLDGSKKEQIDFWTARVNAIKEEIKIYKAQKSDYNILSPISGKIIESVLSDTLLFVGDFKNLIVKIPVFLEDRESISESMEIKVLSPVFKNNIKGKIIHFDNVVHTFNGKPAVLATAEIYGEPKYPVYAMICQCEIKSKPVTLTNYLIKMFKSVSIN
ncbi:MAG: hypothetical protein KAR38_04575 [Calditrichia bacterium]|nr:hypothetical protein [Calditrichia bacterium]